MLPLKYGRNFCHSTLPVGADANRLRQVSNEIRSADRDIPVIDDA